MKSMKGIIICASRKEAHKKFISFFMHVEEYDGRNGGEGGKISNYV
jgi:hypothetical protein